MQNSDTETITTTTRSFASESSAETFDAPMTPSAVGTEDDPGDRVNGETSEQRYGLEVINSREEPGHRLYTPSITPRASQVNLLPRNDNHRLPEPTEPSDAGGEGNDTGNAPRGGAVGER